MRQFLALTLAAAALSAPALAQTAGATPGQIVAQSQASLNQFQMQVQSNQLQHLQQQNAGALSSPDPGVRLQAQGRQTQIQQQIDQTTALQQQSLAPSYNPADLNTRLQQSGSQIQQLQQPPVPTR